jgi:hypothetical protein
MGNFVKITTRIEGGNNMRTWIHQDKVEQLSQNSATQWPNDEGTCLFIDGTSVDIIGFNETIESLG